MSKLTLIQNYLFYITLLPEFLPLIFCILFYKKLNTKALKVFFVYALVLFISGIIVYITKIVIGDIKVYFLYLRIYNIFEYTAIAYFLYCIFKSPVVKKMVILSIVVFLLFAVVDYAIADKEQFNNHSNIVSALLLICFIIYFFYEKMNTVVMYPLYQSITFWICVGLFLYFTGTFFFFLFIKAGAGPDFELQMNTIYALVVIIKNLLISLSLFATERLDDQDNALIIPNDLDLDELSLSNPKNL